MGDKSGWLVIVETKQTLARRLSIKKKSPDRFWFVLEGAMLTWFQDVNGKELGHVHLKSVVTIETEESVRESSAFVLRLADKTSLNLVATSSWPSVTDAAYCKQWVVALRKGRELVAHSFGSSANTGMMF
jgi:hypothetical protein